MKAKTIIPAVLAAICWISLCLDWDILMYLSGFTAMILFGLEDIKSNLREVTEKLYKLSVKNSVTSRSIRKEVVKA